METEQDSAVNVCSLSNQVEKPVDAENASTENGAALTEKTEGNEVLQEIKEANSVLSNKLVEKQDEELQQDCIDTNNSSSTCIDNNADNNEVQSQNERVAVSTQNHNDANVAIKEVPTEGEQATISTHINNVNGNGAIDDHELEANNEVSTENEQVGVSTQINNSVNDSAEDEQVANEVLTESDRVTVSAEINSNVGDNAIVTEDKSVANKEKHIENEQATVCTQIIDSFNDNATSAEDAVAIKEVLLENEQATTCSQINNNLNDNSTSAEEDPVVSTELLTEKEQATTCQINNKLSDNSTPAEENPVASTESLTENEQATTCSQINNKLSDNSTPAEENPVASTESLTENEQATTCSQINNKLNDSSTPAEENPVANTELITENEQTTTCSQVNKNLTDNSTPVEENPVASTEILTENEQATTSSQINNNGSDNATPAEEELLTENQQAATIVTQINNNVGGNSTSAEHDPVAVDEASLEVQKENVINSEAEVSNENSEVVEVIEIDDDEEELNNLEPEIQIIENRLDGIGEIENREKINDFNKKIQQAAQVAIRDLCKKVTGKDIASEPPRAENGDHAVNNAEILNKDNDVQQIQEEPKEIQENQENVEMQRIVQNAISGFFQKSFRNRKTYSFNNSFGNLSIGINTGNAGVINETLTGKFLIQPIVDTALTAIPKKIIEDVLKQVKTLSATEYLMLLLKLKLRNCNETDNPAEPSTTNDGQVKWDKAKYTQLQHIIEPALSTSSQAIIESIMEKAMDLTPAQYLFLYFNLPKAHSDISERCRQAPVRCLPTINQSIVWLLTHLEEYPGSVLPKQVVYQKYFEFCHLNQLKPLGVSDFGKMIKQVLPNVKPKRQVVNGKSFYCYGGLQARFKLDSPSLTKLSNIPQVKEHALFSCHGCCSVFKKMHNHKNRPRGPRLFQVRDANEKITATATTVTSQGVEELGSFYTSSAVDGQEILVHDPMELLSLTMNEDSGEILPQGGISSSVPGTTGEPELEYCQEITSRTQLLRLKNNNRKVKFKQYMHSSVQKTLRKYENIVLPYEVYKFDISPVVILNNRKMKNWCAEFLDNRIQKLSNLIVTKKRNGVDFEVTCKCCNHVSEVTEEQAQKLSDLKNTLKNITIHKRDNLNYSVKYSLEYDEVPNIMQNFSYNNAFRITKKLCGDSLQSHWEATSFKTSPKLPTLDKLALKLTTQHPSVQKLFYEFENLTLPEEVFRSDVDPVIVLDSGEVCEWYEEQLNILKQRLLKGGTGYNTDIQPSKSSLFKHSKAAKTMNLGESDSECSDTGKYKSNSDNVLIQESTETDPVIPAAYPVIPAACSPLQEGSVQIDKSLKRPSADETNEILQKRQKFYCTKMIINNPNMQKPVNEQCFVASPQNLEQAVESAEFMCSFCLKEYNTKRQLSDHSQIHLYCRSCKRRFKKIGSMREHLINHCTMNNVYNKPFLYLHRIDNIVSQTTDNSQSLPKSYLNIEQNSRGNEIISGRRENQRTYTNTMHHYPTVDLINSESNIQQVLLGAAPNSLQRNEPPVTVNSLLNNCKQQQPASYLRVVNAPGKDVTRYEIANINPGKDINQQTIHLQPAGHLRSTISNNFNRILLLSNNSSQPQTPDTYVYLNNSNVQPSPSVQVTGPSNTYNAPDCALGMNRSSTSTEPTTNFMQIVEPSSTTEYPSAHVSIDAGTGSNYEHHDHSYYQPEPTFQTSNTNLSNLNRTVLLNNVAQNELQLSDFEMPYINNINAEIPPPLAPLNSNTNASNSTNPPPRVPGQFRIRVKDISELS